MSSNEKLVAVIAADAFSASAKVLENLLGTPLALTKSPNKTLISASIQTLLSFKPCQKIYVLSKDDRILNAVKEEIINNVYLSSTTEVKIRKLNPARTHNYGDVLRYIDEQHTDEDSIIEDLGNEFIFIEGPYFKLCNGVVQALEQHRESVKYHRKTPTGFEPAMTLIFKKMQKLNGIQSYLFAEKSPSHRVLRYRQRDELKSKKVDMPVPYVNIKINQKNANIEYLTRTDLIQSHVSIVAKKTPIQYTENPDFTDLGDILATMLEKEEVMGLWTHAFISQDQELEPLNSVCQLKSVTTRRLLSQSAGFDATDSEYDSTASHSYLHKSSQIIDQTNVSKSWLAENVQVGQGTRINGSVIMKNSKIGTGCVLHDCYVDEGAVVPDQVKLRNCFISKNYSGLKSGQILVNSVVQKSDESRNLNESENMDVTELTRYLQVKLLKDAEDLDEVEPDDVNKSMQASRDSKDFEFDDYESDSESESDDEECGGSIHDSDDDVEEMNNYDQVILDIKEVIECEDDEEHMKTEFRQIRVRYNFVSTADMVRLVTRSLIIDFSKNFKVKTNLMLGIFPDLITDSEELLNLILRGIEEGTVENNEVDADVIKKTSALVFFELFDLIREYSDEIVEWWNSAKTKHLKGHPYWEKIISQVEESSDEEDSDEESDEESSEEESD